MRKNCLKLVFIVVMLISIVALSSCSKIKELNNNAKAIKTEFLNYLIINDYEAAESLFHDDNVFGQSLEEYVSSNETRLGIDFSDGVIEKGVISFSISYFDSKYNGSASDFEYKIEVSNKNIKVRFLIVDNDKDSGIYDFEIYI